MPMSLIKFIVLSFYVYVYAKLRNRFRSLLGDCHYVILLYHRVSDDYKDSVTVGVDQFKRHIKIIMDKYEIVPLSSIDEIKKKRIINPLVSITFDDGYADNYEAARFLSSRNINATFFISTGIIGTDRPFPHDIKRLKKLVPALSWEQVSDMVQWGHSFGSHTADHTNLASLSVDEALLQIAKGQQDLQKRLGDIASLGLFAYPYGSKEDLPEEVRDSLPKIGVKYCFSAYGGINHSNFDDSDIRRQSVNYAFSDLAFKAALEGWKTRVPKRS
jgi:peptidoglycan/xylan/chitin deacetylase (PgdA/CDA1 family)